MLLPLMGECENCGEPTHDIFDVPVECECSRRRFDIFADPDRD